MTSFITEPYNIKNSVFRTNTLNNGTLIVPYGTIEKYKVTEGWNSFASIEEHKGTCEKPSISYNNGKLIFNCATEGATCISTISDTDISTYDTNEVQLNVTYNINVYAAKEGFNNSETATATLFWIEQEPKAEGDINEVAEIKAYPLLIQSRENKIVIIRAYELEQTVRRIDTIVNDRALVVAHDINHIITAFEHRLSSRRPVIQPESQENRLAFLMMALEEVQKMETPNANRESIDTTFLQTY